MFECLSAAFILTLLMGGSSVIEPNQRPSVPKVAYYSVEDNGENSTDKEYFSSLGNNNPSMDDFAIYQEDPNIELAYSNFIALVKDIRFDTEEFDLVLDFLSALRRNQNSYLGFLNCVKDQLNTNVCSALSIFLSQINYNYIYSIEEDFIFYMLQNGRIEIQECALDTLISWDNFSDINKLKGIKIGNRYLQEDLTAFIGQKA